VLLWTLVVGLRKVFVSNALDSLDFEKQVANFQAELRRAKSPTISSFAGKALGSVQTIYCGKRIPNVVPAPENHDVPSVLQQVVAGLEPNSAEEARRQILERAKSRATAWDDNTCRAQVRANVAHALVFDRDLPSRYVQALNEIRYFKSDYIYYTSILQHIATLKGEDAAKAQVPMILGSGGFLVYPRGGEVVIQRRSSGVDIAPGKLHVFGGNFEPDLHIPGLGHDFDLKSNAAREIAEESRAILSVDDCIVVLHKEDFASNQGVEGGDWKSRAKYLPAHFLGVVLSDLERSRIMGSSEGQTEIVHRRDLVATLRETKDWVPGGWLTVMLWLYLGAPCQGGERFVWAWQARRMFKQVLRS
jgi:hypothetical protein